MLKPSPLKHKERDINAHRLSSSYASHDAWHDKYNDDGIEKASEKSASSGTSKVVESEVDPTRNATSTNLLSTNDKTTNLNNTSSDKDEASYSVNKPAHYLILNEDQKKDIDLIDSAMKDAEKFKATKDQIEEATKFADENTKLAIQQRDQFKALKNKDQGLDINGNPLMITISDGPFAGRQIPTLPSKGIPQKPLPGNPNADARYRQQLQVWKDQEEQIKDLKRSRDTNPMWKYLVDAERNLKYTKDENGKTIANPNAKEDATDENIIVAAKAVYLEDQKEKYLQKNVEEWVDNEDGVGFTMPKTQEDNIAKNEKAIAALDEKQARNVKLINSTGKLYLDANAQMEELNDNFDNRDNYFKGKIDAVKDELAELGPIIKEGPGAWTEANYDEYNSILEKNKKLLDDYDGYLQKRNTFISKFEGLEKTRDGYKNIYDKISKETQEFSEKGEDLLAYHNLMKRNGHFLTGVGATILSSGTELASGIEGIVAEIVMLPQGLRNDEMLGDNPLAQYLVAKADKFEKFRGGQPILDKEGNYIGDTKGYKNSVKKFSESLNNGVELPQLYDDIETLEDFGQFGANVLANFVPQAALMTVSGGSSLYLLGASTAGGSLDESRRTNKLGETNYSLGQRWVHGGMVGGAELISERYTLNLIKGASKAARSRISDGFQTAIKKTFTPKNLMISTNQMIGEGVSEVNASIFGQNAADIFVYGKTNKSLFEGVDEAFVSGVLMERGIAMPGLANRLSQPFRGNQYDSKLKGFEDIKRSIEKTLETEGLSEEVKKDLRNKYLYTQQKQDDLVRKSHENVDMMTAKEVKDLIDLDVRLNNAKQAEDNINADKSLTPAKKEELIKNNRADEADILSQRNKIIQQYENEETRQKREEEYEKQKEVVKAKIAAFNKRQIKSFTKTNTSARGEFKEFETAEEQQAFFNDQISEQNSADRAEIQEMQDLLKQPNITRQDRLAIQNSLTTLRKGIDGRNKYSKTASNAYGFIEQQADGGFQIYVNKENALSTGGNINVGAHEFLHGVLYQTTKGDSRIQKQLGDAVIGFIGEKKGGFSKEFIDKMEPYQGDVNFGEEVITIMSESILDGSLKYEEGFFTKVGDIIRQNLQRLGVPGFKNIKFDTGKDVYNFIKDYNASIEKGYDSKAIDRMMATGAQGKLTETTISAKAD